VRARDYRDDVIETLAMSERRLLEETWLLQEQVHELAERAVRAEASRDSYKLIAVTWAAGMRTDHLEIERLQFQLQRLRDENRQLRGFAMQVAA
jgi:phosphoserine phosphatase